MSIPPNRSPNSMEDDEAHSQVDQDNLSWVEIDMGTEDIDSVINNSSHSQVLSTTPEREPETEPVIIANPEIQQVEDAAHETGEQSQPASQHRQDEAESQNSQTRREADRETQRLREIDIDLRSRFLHLARAWQRDQDWENWFPDSAELLRSQELVEEIDDIIVDWLTPKRFEERLEVLSDAINFLTLRREEVRERERDLRDSPGNNLEARMYVFFPQIFQVKLIFLGF